MVFDFVQTIVLSLAGSLCSVCSTSLSGKSNLYFVSLNSVASYMSPLASISCQQNANKFNSMLGIAMLSASE